MCLDLGPSERAGMGMQAGLGLGKTYLLFAGLAVMAIGSIALTLPETKGKTLEEITEEFRK